MLKNQVNTLGITILDDYTTNYLNMTPKAFQRDIKLAVAAFYKDGQEVARKLLFSTNLQQEGTQIVSYYRSRF